MADAAIAHLDEAFGCFGEVVKARPVEITPELVTSADALIVRSVRRVDAELLEGSKVRFVGSASIGTDHIDFGYLEANGIAFANAPGCNADGVAQYVVNAVYHLANTRDRTWLDGPFGVIGFGNIGTRLTRLLRALGHEVLVNDPPKADAGSSDEPFVSLDEVTERCSVISLHVPRVTVGPHPTHHLLDAETVSRCQDRGALVLNTSRGGILDERGIRKEAAHLGSFVLDTWENEPNIDVRLLQSDPIRPAGLATPHIAGYSREGKRTATAMVHEALAAHLGQSPSFSRVTPDDPERTITLPDTRDTVHALSEAMLATRDLRDTDVSVTLLRELPDAERPTAFARLRDTYELRPQFEFHAVENPGPHADALRALGFRIA